MKRVVVTGSSGYLGRRLVSSLQAGGLTVLGIDVATANENAPDEFHQADIRDDRLLNVIRDFKPDTIIHTAFVVKQMRDAKEMRDINVGGTLNVIRIINELPVKRAMFLSSATAMGAWPDNPVPLSDDAQPRARHEYQYAAEKAELEARLHAMADRNPHTAISWVRPAIVGGPGMNNFLSNFIFGMPVLMRLDGDEHRLQFVHEDDVVGAMLAILNANGQGAFNLAPPSHTTVTEIAHHTNRRVFSVPFRLALGMLWFSWKCRVGYREAPPGFLYFARYPWIIAPDRLINEIGYQFRFSSTDTMLATLQHRKKTSVRQTALVECDKAGVA